MENGSVNKPGNAARILLITIASVIGFFLIYFSVMSVLAPGKRLKVIEDDFYASQPEGKNPDERKFADSAYLRLMHDKSFLQSRIAMAETDSIYLTLNIADSTINIEISGVAVQKIKMNDLKVSKILRKGDKKLIYHLLSEPLTIEKDWSTIRKEPVMVKIAPKDTSEYIPDVPPDTSVVEPVNYIFQMSNGTKIYIYESEKEQFSDRIVQFRFDLADRIKNTRASLKSAFAFKVPEYHPYIKIRIARGDARRIYRAIPRYGQAGIYW